MGVFRGYDQPGNPFARPRWNTLEPAGGEFSDELKKLCEEGAEERLPPVGQQECPHCLRTTVLLYQVSYEESFAGAQLGTCVRDDCGLSHFPIQQGPSEKLLLRIEEQRALDEGLRRAREQQSYKEQLERARAQARKDKHERERASMKSQGEEQVDQDEKERDQEAGETRERREAVAARATAARQLMVRKQQADKVSQDLQTRGGRVKGGGRPFGGIANLVQGPARRRERVRERKIKLLMWGKMNELPVTQTVSFGDAEKIPLKKLVALFQKTFPGTPIGLAHWMFAYAQWRPFDQIEDGQLRLGVGEDCIFLRPNAMACAGFGYYLRLYEESHGLNVMPYGDKRPGEVLAKTKAGVQLFALWYKSHHGPVIIEAPWADEGGRRVALWRDPPELRGELGAAAWQEIEGQWQLYKGTSGARVPTVPNPPVILLRRPDIFGVLGLGEVLEFLDSRRAIQRERGVNGRPAERARTHEPVRGRESQEAAGAIVHQMRGKGMRIEGARAPGERGVRSGAVAVLSAAWRTSTGTTPVKENAVASGSGELAIARLDAGHHNGDVDRAVAVAGRIIEVTDASSSKGLGRVDTTAGASGASSSGVSVRREKGKERALPEWADLKVIREGDKDVIDLTE